MTKIEWTDATWNPIAGCNDVSEGCRHCYARHMAKRLEAMGSEKYKGLTVMQGSKTVWTGKIAFDEKTLLAPLKRRKPTHYFVNSMSDLFHPGVTDEMRDRIFAVMALCPQHTFQVLTKRPEAMLTYSVQMGRSWVTRLSRAINTSEELIKVADAPDRKMLSWPLPNLQKGISVEDQKTADERIPLLLLTPAALRFISVEPLLGQINLKRWLGLECWHEDSYSEGDTNATICRRCEESPLLDWVIVGGESGPGARPMHPDWARSLRDQCKAAGVPFFFKQWGEWAPGAQGADYRKCDQVAFERIDTKGIPVTGCEGMYDASDALLYRVGKKAAGALLDGVEYREMPEVAR